MGGSLGGPGEEEFAKSEESVARNPRRKVNQYTEPVSARKRQGRVCTKTNKERKNEKKKKKEEKLKNSCQKRKRTTRPGWGNIAAFWTAAEPPNLRILRTICGR